MHLFWFIAFYISALAVPAVLFILPLGGVYDSYSASVLFGTISWAIFANQVFLASKPGFALKALGTKRLLAFHGIMAPVGLMGAIVHRTLKVAVGFEVTSVQALLGAAVLASLLVIALVAFLLMSPAYFPLGKTVRSFKDLILVKTPLNYLGLRAFHALTVPLLIILLMHVLMASTAQFSVNPLGFSVMVIWTIKAIILYIRYRMRGRQPRKNVV